MTGKPLYIKYFSRDFTLANMEIWWRGEAHNDKVWMRERQPFQPYIVFEKTPDTVHCYYDSRGIRWMKEKLVEHLKKDPKLLDLIEMRLMESVLGVRSFSQKGYALSHEELTEFLCIFESGYVWFEAAWWLWDMPDKELHGAVLPQSFRKLRENTQDFGPVAEPFIRTSVPRLYPNLALFTDVLRVDELKNNSLPHVRELQARQNGYFLVEGIVYTGVTREFIEAKYNLTLEDCNGVSASEIAGTAAFPGNVTGTVRIVLNMKSLGKVSEGDILVSHMTLPAFLPALEKAAAIVTDEGGMLSHAAIVSRELRKPCIIGTKMATKVLKDGDRVEVDANHGMVRVLSRA